MGHLLYQLGFVSKKAMHKFEQDSRKAGKGSFAYAWVLDETEEERQEIILIYASMCALVCVHCVSKTKRVTFENESDKSGQNL